MMHIIKITLFKFAKKIIHFIHLQLFLTTLSLPVLTYWGLPISLLSPLGNFLFAPVVAIFLFLSSLLFFSHLFGFQAVTIAWVLHYLVQGWLYCLSYGSPYWLVTYTQPSQLVCIVMILLTLFIFYLYRHHTTQCRIGILAGLLILFIGYFLWHAPQVLTTSLACSKKEVKIIGNKDGVIITDLAPLGVLSNGASWVEYTLLTHLAHHYGMLTVKTVIVSKINTRMLQALITLCTVADVKEIYLVCWQGKLNKKLAFLYKQLKTLITQKNIALRRIGTKEITIRIAGKKCTTLTPTDRIITYHDINFRETKVTLSFD